MAEQRLTLKEMCARFDVTPRTLRHYEYIELLAPERDGRTRYYGPREIARMKLILNGRRFGFSLEQTRQWLLLYNREHANRAQTEVWITAATQQIGELEERRRELDETITELRRMRDDSRASLSATSADGK